jgi:hypothetical protein
MMFLLIGKIMNMMYTMWRSDGLPASTWVCVTASLAISISVVDSDRRVRTIVHRRGRGGMRLARGVTGMDFASSLRKTVTEEEGSDAARPGGRCRDGSGPPHGLRRSRLARDATAYWEICHRSTSMDLWTRFSRGSPSLLHQKRMEIKCKSSG